MKIWQPGESIIRRNIWPRYGVRLAYMVFVVEDAPDLFVTYAPEGSPFFFAPGDFPPHPWWHLKGWSGPGVLMLHRKDEPYSVWHFWKPNGDFKGWYLNIQEPFARHAYGYDTRDLALDYWVEPNGEWVVKDLETLPGLTSLGRWSQAKEDHIRKIGQGIETILEKQDYWWSKDWRHWLQPKEWKLERFSKGGLSEPATLFWE